MIEQIVGGLLHIDSQSRQTVGQQIDKQQLYCRKRQRKPQNRCKQHYQNAGQIAGQQKLNRVFNIGVNIAAVANCFDDGGKVVVG